MKKIFCLLLFAVLAGCMTMQARRQQFIAQHPDMPQDQRDALLNGDVAPGMSEEMVQLSWGPPQDIIKEIIKGKERISWLYQFYTGDRLDTYRIWFVDNQVQDLKLVNTQRRVYSPQRRRYYWRQFPEFP